MAKNFEVLQSVQTVYLENTTPPHSKYYMATIDYDKKRDVYLLNVEYGRIGAFSGQTKEKFKHVSLHVIAKELNDLMVKKLFKRGYRLHSNNVWPKSARKKDQKYIEAQSVV